jgi:diguanylate cyclase (GGDEF)-like protein
LNNTAYILHEMKRDEEALPYALQALDAYGEPYSVGRLELLHTLGTIYLQMGDVDRAYFYFEEAAMAAERHENILQKVNALLGICEVHEKKGELETALHLLLTVIQVSQEISSLAAECSAREILARLYKKLGNYQAALEQYEAFHGLHVQIFNEKSEQRIHNTRLLLEVETIQKEANLYRALAATDVLTSLLSRREFFELGGRIMRQTHLEGKPVCLLMIDLDNFKAINDQNGHAVGDRVLSIVARRLKNTLRQDDLAGRYGGDEFVVLMPDLELLDCQRVAERCQSVVAEDPVEVDASSFWISISIGLVVSNADDTLPLEELIQQADRHLLQAKKEGRNRIVTSMFS